MTFLKSLFRRRKNSTRMVASLPAPERPCYIIGDVHGCYDLLENLLKQIELDMRTYSPEAPVLVFLGDYIDRGPDSAAVLARLITLEESIKAEVICLMGNHEQMLLDFLDAPQKYGPRWLRNGSLGTLKSFGVTDFDPATEQLDLTDISVKLRTALPEKTEDWLRGLPNHWRNGNIFVAHAGADPYASLDAQKDEVLIWGHPEFLDRRRNDGNWIAHGHWIIPEANAEDGWISLDTGAYATGRLSAVAINNGSMRFMET